ncbi:MAG: cold-shock protein, partial [Planktomarina sp.]
MANDDEREEFTLYGMVKWFDPLKGFGFIVAEGERSDILLHANILRNFGQNSVADG